MAFLEIEKKFYLSSEQDFERLVNEHPFKVENAGRETDVYFTDGNGDYISNRTCLRTRSVEGKDTVTIDYKPGSISKENLFAKVETNLNLPATSLAGIYDLLRNIGFHKYISVDKKRTSYSISQENQTFTITRDELPGIGSFLECELTVPDNTYSLSDAQQLFDGFFNPLLAKYPLEEVTKPYRDIVADKLKSRWLETVESIVVDFDGWLNGYERIKHISKNKSDELTLGAYNSYQAMEDMLPPPTVTKDAHILRELKSLKELSQWYRISLVTKSNPIDFANIKETGVLENMTMLDQIPATTQKTLFVSSSQSFSEALEPETPFIQHAYIPGVKLPDDRLIIDSFSELSLIKQFAE